MTILRKIFSGIQPTGIPHLGNYLGAIKYWVQLQSAAANEGNMVMFCLMDLHSMTNILDPTVMRENILNMAASLLACGINPNQALLFQQSQVPQHVQLSWLLCCLTSTGKLERMHQWKDRSALKKGNTNLGVFSYPVLMAADILLYKSTHVPVGDDQTQHMELVCDIANAFNRKYTSTFPPPKAMYTGTPRVANLRHPNEKMSKSDPNLNARIDIIDSPDAIARKIRRSVTDSQDFIDDRLDERPGVKNLVEIYASLTRETSTEVVNRYRDVRYFTRSLKEDLTDILADHLKPIREEYERLVEERLYLEQILMQGSVKASSLAAQTMKEVHMKIGFR